MSEPQLVDVFRLRGLGDSTGMGMQVYNPGHHVFPVRINLKCCLAGSAILIDVHTRGTNAGHAHDAVSFNHYVHGAARG